MRKNGEDYFRYLLQTSAGVILCLSSDHKIIEFNSEAERLYGRKREDVLGKDYFELFLPKEVWDAVAADIKKVLKGEPTRGYENPIRTADGSERILQWSVSRIPAGENQFGIMAVGQDITARKRVEKDLESSLSLLRATLESTADGILVVNSEGKMVSFNKKFEYMWGIPRHIVESRDDNQALAFVLDQLKEPDIFISKVRELYSQPDAESYDVLEFKDGRIFERYSRPQHIGEKSVGRVWSFRDVTERRRAEEELRFRSILLDSARDSVFVLDQKGRVIYVNEAAYKDRGFTKEELIGKPIDEVDAPQYKETVRQRMAKLLETGSIRVETEHLKKDGTLMDVEVNARVIEFGGKKVIVGILRDIGERKSAEKKLLKRHSELTVLYKISSAISHTLDMNELFHHILDAVTGIEVLGLERKGAIFIIEGDRMNLGSHLGCSDDFLYAHRGMKVGDCLCGLTAKTGEIIVSKNSEEDERYTIKYPDASHGNIVVPIKIKDIVIGVLVLFRPVGSIDIDEDDIKLLLHVGDQIGIAIDHVRLYEETKALSLHDPLTGLANRRYMDIVLERQFARARRQDSPFAVVMMDIDCFKAYNDTYGHTAGDKLLVKIAQILLREVREMDLVVRYGGEEFLIMLTDAESINPYEVAERIRKTVKEEIGNITVSLGVSSYRQGMQDEEDLITRADYALYQAKQKGRNRVELSG